MAAVHLSLAYLPQPATIPSSAFARNPRKPFSLPSTSRKHRTISISRAVADSSNSSPPGTEAAPPQKPAIELEFLGPKPGVDGSLPVERASAVSGEKLLRNIMLDNKMELYATYGKVMNCGGGGSCGTCIVEILDGKALLNERTNTELRYLKKKPDSWRLACQTIVGNKENSGKINGLDHPITMGPLVQTVIPRMSCISSGCCSAVAPMEEVIVEIAETLIAKLNFNGQ